MAKAVGLDAGEHEVKLVELDGSYRRTRLSKILLERVEEDEAGADDALHASRGAVAALRAFKEVNANRENITLGFPSREAVFRRLTVPFSGREQIRKVIKFEVEGSIHSHSVDDMVRKGRDLEEMVLARAVRSHLERRVIVYGRRTVVFD